MDSAGRSQDGRPEPVTAVHEPVQKPEPSPKPRTRTARGKTVQSGIVLSMEDRAKVVRSERFRGELGRRMSEQKIADTLGWSKSKVYRALNYHGSVHAGSVRGSVHAVA